MSELTYMEKIVLQYVLKHGTIDGISKELYDGVVITDDEAKALYSNTCKKLKLGEGRYSMRDTKEKDKEIVAENLLKMFDELEEKDGIIALARTIVNIADTLKKYGRCSIANILVSDDYPASSTDWKYGFTSPQDFEDFLSVTGVTKDRIKYIKEVRA